VTYADIVRAQFAKHRDAVWCLRILFALCLVATYAPAIAMDIPFWTNLGGHSSFPWFRALFDPSVFKLAVDAFFNLLMATVPLFLLAWFLFRGRRRRWALLGITVLHLLLFLWILGKREEWRQPVTSYPLAIEESHADAIWPLLRHNPVGKQSEFKLTPPFHRGVLAAGAPKPPEALWPYFILGSDNLGNDVLTRLIYGTRISLSIGVIAVTIYVIIGIVLGAFAGYFGGWVDDVLMFFAQAVMVIPFLFLILFIMSVVDSPTVYHIMLVIAVVSWPNVMRLVRGEFLRQREIDYVTAARALGLSDNRVMFRHIVPNTLAPVLVTATFGVASAILLESVLAFLGLGDPGAPSWGQMLNVGNENRGPGTHLIWAGGLAIFFIVLVINVIGEALRDALDPKLRK